MHSKGQGYILTTLYIVSISYLLAVLLGAPLLENQLETLIFSVLLTTLTVIPSYYAVGPESFFDLLFGHCFHREDKLVMFAYSNLWMTIAGGWFGAFFVPLDWDRPWQVWPIPCCAGAVIGSMLAYIGNGLLYVARGRHANKTQKTV